MATQLGSAPTHGGPYFWQPMGYQQISALQLTGATALTVPTGATFAVIQVDTAQVRWRDDYGAVPTATVGVAMAVGSSMTYYGDLTAIKFIAVAGSPVLNISYYR